jgi:FtsH-binding integral membrane protein
MSNLTDSDFARLVSSYRTTRDRYWLTRHYLAASTLVTYIIAAVPGSLNARAIEATGDGGWLVLWFLGVVSLTSLCEAFITAFVPRMSCEWLRHKRHTIFMVIAVGQLVMGYVVLIYAPGSAALVLRFALDAAVAATLAFLDLFARHKLAASAP